MVKKSLLIPLSLLFFLPLIVIAQGGIQLQSPIGATSIDEVIKLILKWLLIIVIPIVAIIAIWAGFAFTTSGGEPEKIKKAREILLYATIGFAVSLVANGIVYTIGDVLGAKKVVISPGSVPAAPASSPQVPAAPAADSFPPSPASNVPPPPPGA